MINELSRELSILRDAIKRLPRHLKFNPKVVSNGIRTSSLAMAEVNEVHLTPYGKEWLHRADLTDKRLLASTETTKFEKELTKITEELLITFVGSELLTYPNEIFSFDNYRVDCWRNFKRDSAIRHIVPNMNKQREEEFKKFSKPLSKPELLNLTSSELVGLDLLNDLIPDVKSSDKWVELNGLFKTKHTNVGYPFFRNDKAIDPSSGKTFGDITDNIARKSKPEEVINYPFIAFGRNQRGKARPILGGSRIQALVFNQLESPEISAYKEHSLIFKGYLSREDLKPWLIKMGKFAETKGLTIINRDYSKFDTTVPTELRQLIGSISTVKCKDQFGKRISRARILSSLRSHLIDGLSKSIYPIYGRIFSGEIDTNAIGGKINAYVTLSSLIADDNRNQKLFYDLIKNKVPPILVMGDDNLTISYPQRNLANIINKRYGMVVSEEKGESNVFFLQNRVCKSKNGDKLIMITPFTRLIRTLINKERQIGLGPYGWTIATIQILSQLIEWPELMWAVTQKIIIPNDKFHLFLDKSWNHISKGVAAEDKLAQKDKGSKFISTFDKLNDGDPQKVNDFKSRVQEAYYILQSFYSKKTQPKK